ncbi:MAG: hypothetical protein HQ481_22190 [Alphaproteobacteria bacterium]|nr:hypothetical protein [Alphaproteobacteria bacterium]
MENNFSASKEFIEQNKLVQTGPKKKGGPYSSVDKHARRDEVYKLHFDYGYSARRIADIIKINRKTIDNDISFLYSKVLEKWGYPDPESWLLSNMENLEIQKTRVREELDKAENIQTRISLERLLLEIESKRTDIEFKLCNSIERTHRKSVHMANTWLKKEKRETRYMSFWDTVRVSPKAHDKIKTIIKREKPFQREKI